MSSVITLGNEKKINKDVTLCYTVNKRTSDDIVRLFIEHHIPFTKNEITIPFFLRIKFHGAKQIYIISTNRNLYYQAKQVIHQLDPANKRKLRFCHS